MNEPATTKQEGETGREVANISPPRLPYPDAIQERFGIDRAGWKALVEAVFPLAQSSDSVVLALSYCKARKLDPFKRVVHIVPVWDNNQRRMVETIWPGIAELRTTAFRTGQYAGRDPAIYGPEQSEKVGKIDMSYPEWCQVTVYRFRNDERMPYPGPRVYWRETYASVKRDDPTPNSMWRKRPHGQIEKCAEAAALRAAFPEELGNEYTREEMEGQELGLRDGDTARPVNADAPPPPTRADFKKEPDNPVETFELVDEFGEIVGAFPAEAFASEIEDRLEVLRGMGKHQEAATLVENNADEIRRAGRADLLDGDDSEQGAEDAPAEAAAVPDQAETTEEGGGLDDEQEVAAEQKDEAAEAEPEKPYTMQPDKDQPWGVFANVFLEKVKANARTPAEVDAWWKVNKAVTEKMGQEEKEIYNDLLAKMKGHKASLA